MEGSKTDGMLKNFEYDGRMKQYLHVLPYNEARIVFMLRAKMFPTKWNFPSRWSTSKLCVFCCQPDTDEHLFSCCGYLDIHKFEVRHDMFMKLDIEMDKLSDGAKILLRIYERLLLTNEDKDVNEH